MKKVLNRAIRQELLKQLQVARFKKETAQKYGSPDEARQYATEASSIELEIKLLKLRK